MAISAFPYIGGKTHLSGWIEDHLPAHETYVEPFGGGAAVLLNKERSTVEVYNDLDGDIVQFFEVARDRSDDLEEWVRRTPYSEELHNEWTQAFYSGERPDDPVERAGRFLYLRYTQFAAKYSAPSGFKRDTPVTHTGESKTWAAVPEVIDDVCQRLQGVSIQNRDYAKVIEHYDAPDTVFYLDPPYLEKEHSYRVSDFEHGELASALDDIEGYALVSYTDRPNGLYPDWNQITRCHGHDAGRRKGESEKEVTERLLLNYDPAEEPAFASAGQTTLGDVVATDGGNSEET